MESRLQLSLSVYFFGALGIFLAVAPWTPVWDGASMILGDGPWGGLARSGWVRGLVTGLGAVNLMLATSDAVVLVRRMRS